MVSDELANLATEAEKKRPEDRTDREKIALLGKPRLGDITRAQIRIKESKEFKVSYFNAHIKYAYLFSTLLSSNSKTTYFIISNKMFSDAILF